ncbi:YjcZ family sporulation protein [Neobacillus niacini]|uniref:YjcZ family sporulation protein n=1 Tax=Neobacillus niacini TaxID=86668 RepID=UPI002FFF3E11
MQMKGSVTMDNMIPSHTMGANVLPQPQMHYGYAAPCVQPRGCDSFIIIIVLFILLIIIGAFVFCD